MPLALKGGLVEVTVPPPLLMKEVKNTFGSAISGFVPDW